MTEWSSIMSSKKLTKSTNRATRRTERKQAAIATNHQQRRLRLMILGIVGAVAVTTMLIILNQPDDPASESITFSSIPQDGSVLGNDAATVAVVEYADYQCPFCGQFAREILPRLIEDFVEPGNITFEFRVFPFLGGSDLTSPSNESVQAAEAAACAMDQGEFWEYNHLLFENQDGENQGAFSDDRLQAIAGQLGLDQDAFSSCLDSSQHQQDVLDDFTATQAAGINSTPTLLINGQTVQYTTQGYDLLKRQIEAALAGEPLPQ